MNNEKKNRLGLFKRLLKDWGPLLGISIGTDLDDARTVEDKYRHYPQPWIRYILFLLFVLCIVYINSITVEYSGVTARGWGLVKASLRGLITPSWKVIVDTSSTGLMHMLLETLNSNRFFLLYLSTFLYIIRYINNSSHRFNS